MPPSRAMQLKRVIKTCLFDIKQNDHTKCHQFHIDKYLLTQTMIILKKTNGTGDFKEMAWLNLQNNNLFSKRLGYESLFPVPINGRILHRKAK